MNGERDKKREKPFKSSKNKLCINFYKKIIDDKNSNS